MQNGQEANLGSQVLRVRSDFKHRGGARTKQQVIKQRLVSLTKRIEFMRQSENDVKIRYTEHFLLTSSEPSLARLRLTLRAVPVTAGVIGDGLMAALGTGIEMAAQGRRAATGDRSQHCQLLEA
jgi:hypothetical protein